jgi:hypothetical protein
VSESVISRLVERRRRNQLHRQLGYTLAVFFPFSQMLSFKSSDINSLLKPIFGVLSVIGLVPCILRYDDLQNIRSSRFTLVYSVTAVSTLLLCQVLGTWEVSKLFYLSSLYYMVDVIKVIAIIVSGVILLFCCLFYKRNIVSIIHSISIFDQNFRRMFHFYNEPSLFSVSHICIYFVVDLVSFSVSILFTEFSDHVLAMCGVHLSLFIIQLLDLMFMAFVYLLGQRFRLLNLCARESLTDHNGLGNVNYFKYQHGFLCDISEVLNTTFAVQTLMIVAFKFISLTSYSYFGIVRMLSIHSSIRGTVTRECVMYGWSCWNLVTLLSMFWLCSSTCREVSVFTSHFQICNVGDWKVRGINHSIQITSQNYIFFSKRNPLLYI